MISFNKKTIWQFIRFGIVGMLMTLLHYGIYWLLIHYINVSVSYTIGYVLSFIVNFYLTSFFTFKSKPTIKRGAGFLLSHGMNYLLHIVLLNVFLYMGLNKTLAPIPVFCIVIPINFILVRYVFTK